MQSPIMLRYIVMVPYPHCHSRTESLFSKVPALPRIAIPRLIHREEQKPNKLFPIAVEKELHGPTEQSIRGERNALGLYRVHG